MLNKLILILLAGLLTLSLDAQSYRSRRRNRQTTRQSQPEKDQKKEDSAKKQNSSTAKKQISKKSSSSSALSKFKKPVLTQDTVSYVLDTEIKKQLLERKLPAKIPGSKSSDGDNQDEDSQEGKAKPEGSGNTGKNKFLSQMGLAILISRYKSLIANFELTEVTGIPQEWYQHLLAELQKFGLIINEMEIAIRIQSNGRYAAGLQKFKAHQKVCLKFLKETPPKISKEQYEALVLKNTQIRRRNYLKQQEEKRRAELQRQKEQLKQLQQKSRGNQKQTSGGSR